ncbi:DUF763 domain-containing protein (plasmid) [Sinorhizobium meliloti]|nr:DUF763 domain-containing protein [Sinorhizobium meliloti]WQP25247.1 DUF763 domain-containing protein [Sinorhizobium meliloti]
MAQRAGNADLPLHGGRVPRWLGDRMTRLGALVTEAVVHHYGRDEFLRRLAHPFWFQSFGAVMGMDWHSSGITTSVIGALKRGLTPLAAELGIHVCGGRGQHPHSAIEGREQGEIVNLADRRAAASRTAQLDLLQSLGPDGLLREVAQIESRLAPVAAPAQPMLPHLFMPAHHDVRESDVNLRRLHGNFAAAADRGPEDFKDLLLVPGVGARTVKALAMVAELVHGTPCRFSDPARFSLAHGGKDRHPFPVPLKVYDETIRIMKSAVSKGRLGRQEELAALKRLDEQSRRLERYVTGPDLKEIVAGEFRDSARFGGRSIFGWEPHDDEATAAVLGDRARR